MNRKLNIFSSVGFAALSLLACVSCGGGGNPTSEPVTSVPTSESTSSSETVSETVDNSGVDFVVPEAGFNTNETVTITFYHTMGQALQEVLDIYLEDLNVDTELDTILENARVILGIAPEDVEIVKQVNYIAKLNNNKLYINPEIVKFDKETIEYIIFHEFCHIQYKTHSKKFYEIMQSFFPNYKQIEENLIDYKY